MEVMEEFNAVDTVCWGWMQQEKKVPYFDFKFKKFSIKQGIFIIYREDFFCCFFKIFCFLMKRHIISWLFTKLDDFLPFFLYMVEWSLGNKSCVFCWKTEVQFYQSLNHVDGNLKLQFLIKSGYYIVPSPSTTLKYCISLISWGIFKDFDCTKRTIW